MEIRQYEVWLADLNPRAGTEAGKTRPVLVVQTDLLNRVLHPSTLICPITSKVSRNSEVLRVHLSSGTANLLQECDILMDQLRAIDNRRLLKRIGTLPEAAIKNTRKNLKIMLDLD